MESKLLLCFCLGLTLVSIGAEEDISRLTTLQIYKNLNGLTPCTDFWNFACGGFSKASHFEDNFEWIEDQYASAMVEILESNVGESDALAPRLINQMKSYYKTCKTDHTQWSINDPKESLREWMLDTNRYRNHGLNGVLFDERVDVATNDSLQRVIQIKMPERSASYSVRQALQLIEQHPWEYTEQMLQLVAKLRRLETKYRQQEPLVQTWRIRELQQQIPHMGWHKIVAQLLDVDTDSSELDGLLFEVSDVSYLQEMDQLIAETDDRVYHQYLRVRQLVLIRESELLNRNPRTCIHHMRALLPLGMNYIYNRFVYKNREQDTRQLQEIFSSLKTTFGKYLDYNRLNLTREQLTYLRAKLAKMQLKLGNLPEEISPEFYDTHYQSANFTDSNYLNNLREALALRTHLQHEGLLQSGSRLDLNRYYVNDDVVKARTSPFYENERNTITVPLVFLQWPLFDHRQHPVFQHSLIGAVLAHEMNHAFEQEGVLFDAAGNEATVGWEIRETQSFKNAIRCAKERPFVSLKERLADINGLQLAYDAFFGLNHDSRQFEYRPYSFDGVFTPPQMFHLSYAQFFCGNLPPVIAHDRDNERVNVSVGNLRQFAYDFKCGTSTEQSPICEMWRPREESMSG
ncbi:hypothetical protein KR009_009409 [Drosophila setifemur]|nr:hypothetical protein KR009_009409 [Drosophila setifemur]